MADPKPVEGMDLFEVYEEGGALLYVASFVEPDSLSPGDRMVRRPWATAAKPVEVRRV